MTRLRQALWVIALGALLVAGYLFVTGAQGGGRVAMYYLGINGAVVALALLIERARYVPRVKATEGWQPTGEKFIDEATGKTVEVMYNPVTGERKYQHK